MVTQLKNTNRDECIRFIEDCCRPVRKYAASSEPTEASSGGMQKPPVKVGVGLIEEDDSEHGKRPCVFIQLRITINYLLIFLAFYCTTRWAVNHAFLFPLVVSASYEHPVQAGILEVPKSIKVPNALQSMLERIDVYLNWMIVLFLFCLITNYALGIGFLLDDLTKNAAGSIPDKNGAFVKRQAQSAWVSISYLFFPDSSQLTARKSVPATWKATGILKNKVGKSVLSGLIFIIIALGIKSLFTSGIWHIPVKKTNRIKSIPLKISGIEEAAFLKYKAMLWAVYYEFRWRKHENIWFIFLERILEVKKVMDCDPVLNGKVNYSKKERTYRSLLEDEFLEIKRRFLDSELD